MVRDQIIMREVLKCTSERGSDEHRLWPRVRLCTSILSLVPGRLSAPRSIEYLRRNKSCLHGFVSTLRRYNLKSETVGHFLRQSNLPKWWGECLDSGMIDTPMSFGGHGSSRCGALEDQHLQRSIRASFTVSSGKEFSAGTDRNSVVRATS